MNKQNSLEDLKRSGLNIDVTPQVSITKRDQELMTVVEEEALAASQGAKFIVQPHSKRSKIGRKIFCCCMSKQQAKELPIECELDQQQEVTIQGDLAGANNAISQENSISHQEKEAQMIGF